METVDCKSARGYVAVINARFTWLNLRNAQFIDGSELIDPTNFTMLSPLPGISACRKCLSKNHPITRQRITSFSSDSDNSGNSPVLVPSEAKD